MSYHLGIDLGTTYSAAAVHRDGRAAIVQLGSRAASIPSVVFLRDDGTILAGEAAQRRAATDPRRVAREFKRRLGDTTPLLLGGTPYSAEALTGRLLRWIVEQVAEREGGAAAGIAVAHPANWGPYKIDLLEQAIRIAGLDDVALVTEPDAAVRHYASAERVEAGSVVAVYDLGGGTFDATVMRKTASGFESLGRPEGIERLGGIDFDAAVLAHVNEAIDRVLDSVDPDDPGTLQTLARLRQECVDAKEALSSDTEVSIPVLLANLSTEVRLTRAEFEAMIRPSLADSLDAMRRALASAAVEPGDVTTILLVGGSSRIPLVAQLVSNEFGRPVAVDTDPKHAIALGAALVAAERADAAVPTPVAATPASPSDQPATQQTATEAPRRRPTVVGAAAPSRRRNPALLIGVFAATALAAAIGFAVFRTSGGDTEPVDAGSAVAEPAIAGAGTTIAPATTTPVTTAATALPATAGETTVVATTTDTVGETTVVAAAGGEPSPCPVGPERTVCISSIAVDDAGGLVAEYESVGYEPELEPIDWHIHFYFDTVGDERNAGTAGTGGDWRLWDAPHPFAATGGEAGRPGYTLDEARLVGATSLCAIVADTSHAVVEGTGNCIDIPEG